MDRKKSFFRINQRIDQAMEVRFSLFLQRLRLDPPTDEEFVYLVFDSPGGRHDSAIALIEMMYASGYKFFAIAMGRVHSAAIPIYLSCCAWFCYGKATALLHRAQPEKGVLVTKNQGEKAERQVFQTLSERLKLSIEQVYSLADNNTVIEENTELGRKFFLNIR